ncbi:MAG: nucleotide-binding protein [Clostridiales bacterium]|nr:nucleotide-binding protein [Clostridiales bacterium]
MSKKLFIASSSEGLEYATALQRLLSGHFAEHNLNIACVRWKDRGVFRNGESTLANLERIADELYAKGDTNKMGYAACVLTPDEIITMRSEEYSVARDNVLFEYGLFLGKLGHARTFLLIPPEKANDDLPKFHTLSDLKGITSQYYQSYEKNANSAQAEDALFKVAQGIFYDIFEIEKKLSPPIPSDNARTPTPTNSSSSNAALKVGDYVGDRTESGRSLTKY